MIILYYYFIDAFDYDWIPEGSVSFYGVDIAEVPVVSAINRRNRGIELLLP
ncbi:MAG: hypothetical protein ACI83O_000872 [Patescibacteria group bacterium]|jgi:hypothetical protein